MINVITETRDRAVVYGLLQAYKRDLMALQSTWETERAGKDSIIRLIPEDLMCASDEWLHKEIEHINEALEEVWPSGAGILETVEEKGQITHKALKECGINRNNFRKYIQKWSENYWDAIVSNTRKQIDK